MDQNLPRRTAKACVICHKKKIKCDVIQGSSNPCTACVRDGYECRPRQRKRKRIYTLDSESPPPKSRKDEAHHSPNSLGSRTENSILSPGSVKNSIQFQGHPSRENGYNDPMSTGRSSNPPINRDLDHNTEVSIPSAPASAQSNGRPSFSYQASKVSYLGRSEYIGDDVPINDEEDAPPHSTRGLSEKDMEILQVQNVFNLPTRPVRESLIDSFWTRCYPWTPIVERQWLEGRPQNDISILLLQSMMLAGSRVSSSPIEAGSSAEYYNKAKMYVPVLRNRLERY
jgi:hypothetical protein